MLRVSSITTSKLTMVSGDAQHRHRIAAEVMSMSKSIRIGELRMRCYWTQGKSQLFLVIAGKLTGSTGDPQLISHDTDGTTEERGAQCAPSKL